MENKIKLDRLVRMVAMSTVLGGVMSDALPKKSANEVIEGEAWPKTVETAGVRMMIKPESDGVLHVSYRKSEPVAMAREPLASVDRLDSPGDRQAIFLSYYKSSDGEVIFPEPGGILVSFEVPLGTKQDDVSVSSGSGEKIITVGLIDEGKSGRAFVSVPETIEERLLDARVGESEVKLRLPDESPESSFVSTNEYVSIGGKRALVKETFGGMRNFTFQEEDGGVLGSLPFLSEDDEVYLAVKLEFGDRIVDQSLADEVREEVVLVFDDGEVRRPVKVAKGWGKREHEVTVVMKYPKKGAFHLVFQKAEKIMFFPNKVPPLPEWDLPDTRAEFKDNLEI